jgi:hypothetical protein
MHQEASMDKQFQLMFISALIPLQLYVNGFIIGVNFLKIQIQLRDNSMSQVLMIQQAYIKFIPTRQLMVQLLVFLVDSLHTY